ncbi:MAG: ribosome biogenesis GTP-binding protein YihA/YsxC [Synergistaceae bacterium]|nr:ribosome biogenesis GTP-binding protein YihA/YsxC [Synergistaceae bacterium]
MTHWRAELVCTAFEMKQMPEPLMPEVAIAGRSNVGKSTLINALLNRTSSRIAHVSSKPGKTRSLNFYRIDPGDGAPQFMVVDLPGYGYAARSADEREGWLRLVNGYFGSGRDIPFVIHLMDFRHGPLAADAELTAWLDAMDMPRLVVFTKGDKAPKSRARSMYLNYLRGGLVSVSPPLVTAGKNDAEAERLREAIPRIIKEVSRL